MVDKTDLPEPAELVALAELLSKLSFERKGEERAALQKTAQLFRSIVSLAAEEDKTPD
ncbi:MAG: hypothetical protein ACI9FJ_000643 [Alteromonadaceae bacterium]|jgi:hypothetical protein